jgi:hypothetical protein
MMSAVKIMYIHENNATKIKRTKKKKKRRGGGGHIVPLLLLQLQVLLL